MSNMHRTVSEYSINSAPEAETKEYDMICPKLPNHGKPNMFKDSCDQRRKVAAKSKVKTACSRWPNCGETEATSSDELRRHSRTALTTIVGNAIKDGKTYSEIVAEYGMCNSQISKHKRIIQANPDLYPEFINILEFKRGKRANSN